MKNDFSHFHNNVLMLVINGEAHLYACQSNDLVRNPVFPISKPSVFVTALSISCPEGLPPHTPSHAQGVD